MSSKIVGKVKITINGRELTGVEESASSFRIRYAVNRTSSDRFPVTFRPDCERTPCDWKGDSETYLEVKDRLDRAGYDLLDELPEWALKYPHKRPRDE